MGLSTVAELVWTPDRAAVRALLTGSSGPGYTAVRRVQDRTAALADMKTPVDTGALKQAQVKTPIVVEGDKITAGVEYRSPYALFVHEGTRAHVIRPRNKKVLAWVPRGAGAKTRFASSVNHPGTRPQRWLRTALFFAARSQGFTTSEE